MSFMPIISLPFILPPTNTAIPSQGRHSTSAGGIENSLSLMELFSQLGQLFDLKVDPETGSPLKFKMLPRRQSDQDFFVPDISKATRLMGWRPQVSCTKGLKLIIEWCRGRN